MRNLILTGGIFHPFKESSRALQKILNSYHRLAISYARKYSSYGLAIDDLIHEGVLGIMHALDKFDTKKDFVQNIKAGTHPYDLTVRPQILKKESNEKYYNLINSFYKIFYFD